MYPQTRQKLTEMHSPTNHIKYAHHDRSPVNSVARSPVQSPSTTLNVPFSPADTCNSNAWKMGAFPHIMP